MEEWSLAKSSLPGIGRDKSWKVSTVVETCHTFRETSVRALNNTCLYHVNRGLSKQISVWWMSDFLI